MRPKTAIVMEDQVDEESGGETEDGRTEAEDMVEVNSRRKRCRNGISKRKMAARY